MQRARLRNREGVSNGFIANAMLPNWNNAMKGMDAGTVDPILLFDGDSETAGQFSNDQSGGGGDFWSQSYPAQLVTQFTSAGRSAQRNAILANGPTLSPGYHSAGDPRYMPKGANWQVSGSATGGPWRTLGGNMLVHVSAATDNTPITFSGIDTFRLRYPKPAAGGNLVYKVDSGAETTVSLDGAGTDQGFTTIDIPCGSVGSHTLYIRCSSALTGVFGAVEGINSTVRQIRALDAAVPGSESSYNNETTKPWSPGNNLGLFNHHAVIIMTGVNDLLHSNEGTNAVNITNNLNSRIDGYRSQRPDGDVIVMTTVPFSTTLRTQSIQDKAAQNIRDVASAKSCLLIDIYKDVFLGSYDAANPFGYYAVNGGNAHPNAVGYGKIKDAVFSKLWVPVGAFPSSGDFNAADFNTSDFKTS